jgi:hypothetical protein
MTVPTTVADSTTIGAYEGAAYCNKGVYRAQNNGKMRALGTHFCAVCTRYLAGVYTKRARNPDTSHCK